MTFDALHQHRRAVLTSVGPASYLDVGTGPPALFIHGVGTSSLLWRNVIPLVADQRRCIAIDLPLHGETPAAPDQDFSLPALAGFVAAVCDALDLSAIDLIANDTGGAVAQLFAVSQQDRLRSLVLTNCEAHDNIPPRAFLPTVLLARAGLLAHIGARGLDNIGRAQKRIYGSGFEDINAMPTELARAYLTPLFGTRTSSVEFQRWVRSLRSKDLAAIDEQLAQLQTPTAIVWGTADPFFSLKWAHWLRDTIPGATTVTEVVGGKLFFPDERASELADALRIHWSSP